MSHDTREETIRNRPLVARPGRPRLPRVHTFSCLRNQEYRYLWIGNLFNTGANWLQQLTIGWLVWDLFHSPFPCWPWPSLALVCPPPSHFPPNTSTAISKGK
jgi:hypothetical protein